MKRFKQYINEKSEVKLKKSLYIHRNLQNTEDFLKWAKEQGFESTLKPEDLHVTQAYSKKKVDWSKMENSPDTIKIVGGKRKVIPLGDKGAVVLKFESGELQNRFKELMSHGCSFDYPEYQCHVTVSYNGNDVDLDKVTPYTGTLKFGPEVFEELDDNWEDKVKETKV